MKDFTVIPNPILRPSQLTIQARYLLCVLLRYCGNKETCYPSQTRLGKDLKLTSRQVRFYLNELICNGLIFKTRSGFNKPNTYAVAKFFTVETQKIISIDKKSTSDTDKKPNSAHIRSTFPLHSGREFPPNNTYIIAKDNNGLNKAGFDKFKENLIAKGIIPDRQNILRKNDSKTRVSNLSEVLQQKTEELSFKGKPVDSSPNKTNTISGSHNSACDQKESCAQNSSSPKNKPSKFFPVRSSKIDSRHAV